jgi:RND family efflux transporter MFP subunit
MTTDETKGSWKRCTNVSASGPVMTTDETKATTADTTQTPAVSAGETAQGDSVVAPLSAGGPLPGVSAGATAQGAGPPPGGRARVAFVGLAAAVLVLGVVIYAGIRSRVTANATLTRATEQAAIPTVDVVYPKADAPTQEIVLPGNTQAFISAPIYARTSGYLKRWYFDIGAHVKKGQLLAEIESPEVDQQLQQAQADLKTAQANLALAKITADRWQGLLKTNSVSQQETDQAVGNYRALQATLDAQAANVRRLEQLQSFEKIYAPFDGVITARNTDVGALINAGAGTQGLINAGAGMPVQGLFTLAAIDKLRVYVTIPEVYARAARPGATASLLLDAFPGEVFHGTLVRQANAIDPTSRTLLVEVDVDNATGQLMPGAYVSVHLTLPDAVRAVTIPANTLLFRKEGLRVGVVRQGKAALVPVTIGRDYGAAVEVMTGLQPTDAVILNPADSLITGTPVKVNTPPAGGATPTGGTTP